MLMRRPAIALAIASFFCGHSARGEGNRSREESVKGTYAYTSTQTCAASTIGFATTSVGISFLPAPTDADNDRAPSAFYFTQVLNGTRTFDGKGGWHQDFASSTINLSALPQASNPVYPHTSVAQVADGTYSVGADGVVTVTSIVLHINFLSGPRKDRCMQDNAGHPLLDARGNPAPLSQSRCTVYVGSKDSSALTYRFQVVAGGGLLSAAADEQIETEDYDGIFPRISRTCIRSSTNARLPERGDDGEDTH